MDWLIVRNPPSVMMDEGVWVWWRRGVVSGGFRSAPEELLRKKEAVNKFFISFIGESGGQAHHHIATLK